jgi:DNA-binding NarL/FixJ family response regulator
MVRTGINRLLRAATDIIVVGEASDGAEAIRLVNDLDPDVLLLDIEMPVLRGDEVARKLRDSGSPVRILALSAYNDRQYIRGMLSSGASGYLTKEEVLETIVDAVRGVAKGETGWVSRKVAQKMSEFDGRAKAGREVISGRETEVLRLVGQGKTNQEIASELGISKKTVEKHLRSVFVKLKVSSRVQAAEYAFKQGLI